MGLEYERTKKIMTLAQRLALASRRIETVGRDIRKINPVADCGREEVLRLLIEAQCKLSIAITRIENRKHIRQEHGC